MDYFKAYQLTPIDIDILEDGFQRWALDFFRDATNMTSPYLDITIQCDITAAAKTYEIQGRNSSKTTLTSWLVWNWIQALKAFPSFQLRCIENQWYKVNNPPLFTPIATNNNDRFVNLIIENAFKMTWDVFSTTWAELKEAIFAGMKFTADHPMTFGCSQFIGNLPKMQFTQLTMHEPKSYCQAYFYFGSRYQQGDRLFMPLAAKIHHSTSDPHLLQQLFDEFEGRFRDDISDAVAQDS